MFSYPKGISESELFTIDAVVQLVGMISDSLIAFIIFILFACTLVENSSVSGFLPGWRTTFRNIGFFFIAVPQYDK